MSVPLSAAELMDAEFLEVRAKLLQVAATFDRINRADGSTPEDARMEGLREALQVLLSDSSDRAEQIQLIFSRNYDDDWQTNLGMPR